MYDPDITGAGSQPIGYDDLTALYSRYRVWGCEVEFEFAQMPQTLNAGTDSWILQNGQPGYVMVTVAPYLSRTARTAFMPSWGGTLTSAGNLASWAKDGVYRMFCGAPDYRCHFKKFFYIPSYLSVNKEQFRDDYVYSSLAPATQGPDMGLAMQVAWQSPNSSTMEALDDTLANIQCRITYYVEWYMPVQSLGLD